MSIQNEIERINQNISNSYSAVQEMGGTIPNTQNSYNLANAVRSIPSGGTEFTPDDTLTLEDGILSVSLPTKSLTTAEYNALSEEEKMADVQYIITDDNNSTIGGDTSEEIYSTEEVRIGTWIDGKPLYKKTIYYHINTGSTNTTVVLDGLERNTIDALVDQYGALTVDDNRSHKYYYTLGTFIGGFFMDSSNFVFYQNNSSSLYNYYGFATFKYTKTTN